MFRTTWAIVALAGVATAADPAPKGTFRVTDFGATPDDNKDDTPAVRRAIAAAAEFGPTAVVHFPAGTYDVCPQPDDPVKGVKPFRPIFDLKAAVTFRGDGPSKSILRGWCEGLKDPVKHWTDLDPKAYFKVQRFGLFRCIPGKNDKPVGKLAFVGLAMDGQCPYTGDHTVGGKPATGDGWDMTHKALHFDGVQPIEGVEVKDCDLRNWKGEIVYAGGTALKAITLTDTRVRGCNASAVSVSAGCTMTGCTIGGEEAGDRVYNGVENFCLNADQFTTLTKCTIRCGTSAKDKRGNGIAYIGVSKARLRVEGCDLRYCGAGILLSETAKNVTVKNCRFADNGNAVINSILKLYPKVERGFADITLEGNTLAGGSLYVNQVGHCTGLKVIGNTLTAARLLEGTFDAPDGKPAEGFEVRGNVLTEGAKDVDHNFKGTAVALWADTKRGDKPTATAGQKVDAAGKEQVTVSPATDLVWLNSPGKAKAVAVTLGTDRRYPSGFRCRVVASGDAWTLRADKDTTAFEKDVPVPKGVDGVRLEFRGGKWHLAE